MRGRLPCLVDGVLAWMVSLACFAALMRCGTKPLRTAFVLCAVIHVCVVFAWDRVSQQVNRGTALEWVGVVLAVAAVLLIESSQG